MLLSPLLFPGGYLYPSDGFLPEDLRPNDLVCRSYLVPSNNGMSQPFSFTVTPAPPYANIPSGYILQVTNAGAIVVQCAGTFGNIIPRVLRSCYQLILVIWSNLRLSWVKITSFSQDLPTLYTNTTGQLRDSHSNDAFDNVLAWAWTDNSNQTDKSNNILNVYVAIGKVKKDGALKVRTPIQLSNLVVPYFSFDTAVAINRSDKNNIVVSWMAFNYSDIAVPLIHRAVSFDGGKTWPINTALATIPSFNNIGGTWCSI